MRSSLQVVSQGPESALRASSRPKVLLTDTDRRSYTARLALALVDAGCDVAAICSNNGDLVRKTGIVTRIFPYGALRPVDSLIHAISESSPDVIVPCDDRGVRHLHELHASAQSAESARPGITDLIERSLGSPGGYAAALCRYDLLRIAHEEGLRVPRTELLQTEEDLARCEGEQRFPWVIKADETWGGRGVRIAHSRKEAQESFAELSHPFRLPRVLKRASVNRDPFWVKPWWERRKPSIVVQAHIQGRPANCAVVCSEGKVLAGIAVEVLSADGPTGPASIVRIVDDSTMMNCAERIAQRLKISGFFGLDFVIEDGTNEAYLIEMNPRCTPLCHLRLGVGRDMIGALWAQLSGSPVPATEPVTDNNMIAYFPQALKSRSEYLSLSFLDVPQAPAELIDEFLRPWPERSLLFRLMNRLQQLRSTFASHTSRKSVV